MRSMILCMLGTLFMVHSASAQLLQKGDKYIGGKIALGAIAGASFGLIGGGEYGIDNDIGAIGNIGYSSYSTTYSFGTWTYTNILLLAGATYHYKFIENDKLDTFGGFQLGYNIGSSSWSGSGIQPTSDAVGGIVWGFSANVRYFISPKLALAGSVGIGLGLLNVGIDYKL